MHQEATKLTKLQEWAQKNYYYHGYYFYHAHPDLDLIEVCLMNLFYSLEHNGVNITFNNRILAEFLRIELRSVQRKIKDLTRKQFIKVTFNKEGNKRKIECLILGIQKGRVVLEDIVPVDNSTEAPNPQLETHDPGVIPPMTPGSSNNIFSNIKQNINKTSVARAVSVDNSTAEQQKASQDQVDYDILLLEFDRFWKAWPKEVSQDDKDEARKAFQKACDYKPNLTLTDAMIEGIKRHISTHWLGRPLTQVPAASRFIKEARYMTEWRPESRTNNLEPRKPKEGVNVLHPDIPSVDEAYEQAVKNIGKSSSTQMRWSHKVVRRAQSLWVKAGEHLCAEYNARKRFVERYKQACEEFEKGVPMKEVSEP